MQHSRHQCRTDGATRDAKVGIMEILDFQLFGVVEHHLDRLSSNKIGSYIQLGPFIMLDMSAQPWCARCVQKFTPVQTAWLRAAWTWTHYLQRTTILILQIWFLSRSTFEISINNWLVWVLFDNDSAVGGLMSISFTGIIGKYTSVAIENLYSIQSLAIKTLKTLAKFAWTNRAWGLGWGYCSLNFSVLKLWKHC